MLKLDQSQAIRHVPRHFGKATKRTVGRADRGDGHVCPKARTVSAHTPAFIFNAALRCGKRQFRARLAARNILGRIENRKVLPDDFPGRVALDALRPLVPARDMPLRIKHEDGVVLYCVDKQPEVDIAWDMRKCVAGELVARWRAAVQRWGVSVAWHVVLRLELLVSLGSFVFSGLPRAKRGAARRACLPGI